MPHSTYILITSTFSTVDGDVEHDPYGFDERLRQRVARLEPVAVGRGEAIRAVSAPDASRMSPHDRARDGPSVDC